MRIFYTVVFSVVCLINSVAHAHHLSQADMEYCANTCLAQAISGERDVLQCVSLPMLTRQVVGRAAASMSPEVLAPVQEQIEIVLRREIDNLMRRANGATVSLRVDNYQLSSRQPEYHLYGVRGHILTSNNNRFDFTINGVFTSRNHCMLHTVAVDVVNINNAIRTDRAVDRAVQRALRQSGL